MSDGNKPPRKKQNAPLPNWALLMIAAGIMLGSWVRESGKTREKVTQAPISQLFEKLNKQEITAIEVRSTNIRWTVRSGASFRSVDTPLHVDKLVSTISDYNQKHEPIRLEVKPPPSPLLLEMLPWLLFIAVIFFLPIMMKRPLFSRLKASQVNGTITTTFRDVAGIDEAEEEVSDVVDFLKNPGKYQELGAKIPSGVLLVGPPGCGKTLLARAVAGEAGVPFFTICGSDFIEMFVGVGASRVRELFAKAKEQAPSIIFIDEIDAVGGKRSSMSLSGHDEGGQTLNAMLSEMDGFTADHQVIVFGATNRPDTLDPALLRPGRFDRQVNVSLPDQAGRLMILKVHANRYKISPNADIKTLAATTAGMSGAELENILNEAAIICVKRGGKQVEDRDLEESRDKQMMGKQLKSRRLSDEDKKIAAVHEAGHATAQSLLPGCDSVHKITIIPQGHSLGLTMFLPKRDIVLRTKTQLLNQIKVLLAGRVAEELFAGDITTGAVQDIQLANEIARDMVGRFGMDDELHYLSAEVRDRDGTSLISAFTARRIDERVCAILDQAHAEVATLIKEQELLTLAIADALVEKESLTADEVNAFVIGQSKVA